MNKDYTKIGEVIETGVKSMPRAQIIEFEGTYAVMIQLWSLMDDEAYGWTAAYDGSLEGCERYIKKFIARGEAIL